jgi:hypothetical protein
MHIISEFNPTRKLLSMEADQFSQYVLWYHGTIAFGMTCKQQNILGLSASIII